MKSMIERVVVALAAYEACTGDDGIICEEDCICKARAIAAMTAMREPTEQMLSAFNRHCDETGSCMVKTGYRAMIDAALPPSSPT